MKNNSLFFFLINLFSITTFSIDIIVDCDLHVIVVKLFPLTSLNSHLNSALGYVKGKSKFIFFRNLLKMSLQLLIFLLCYICPYQYSVKLMY